MANGGFEALRLALQKASIPLRLITEALFEIRHELPDDDTWHKVKIELWVKRHGDEIETDAIEAKPALDITGAVPCGGEWHQRSHSTGSMCPSCNNGHWRNRA